MYDYAKLISAIPVPEGLQEQVLSRTEKKTFPLLPAAVCALVALALVSAPTLYRREAPPQSERPVPALASPAAAANHTLVLPLEETVPEGGLTLTLEGREYLFTAERLGTFFNEDGAAVLSPVLAGETRETISALYAPTEESRFLSWPVAGSSTVSLSNAYGARETPNGPVFHAGIDIPGETGLTVTAAASGTVTETGFDPQRGNYLILDHGGGLTTLYGQCREVLAAQGQSVSAGDAIALLGSTGISTGPHLHFEVRQDGEAQNPVAYFDSAVRNTLKMG